VRFSALGAALAGGAALLCTALAGAPAVAAASTGFAPMHVTDHIGHVAGFNQNGQNWSGYAVTGSGFTSVSATWVQPQATCSASKDLYAPWVGIDGYGTTTVEQTGVQTDCSSGSPVDSAWYEMYPAAPSYYTNAVSAGDSITATVTRSGTSYTLVTTDNTKNWSKTTTKSLLRAKNGSAEIILESPSAAYPNFGTVTFTNVSINGKPLSSFNGVALDASNTGGYEDHTSAITGGNSFSVAYERQ
jgi:hypothetical protein